MKLTYATLLASFGLLFNAGAAAQPLELSVEAEAAILMNAETGAILFEKNSKVAHYPASITKIATAMYALEQKGGNLEELATADQQAIASIAPDAKIKANYRLPAYWVETRSSHIGIKKGEKMSLEVLLHGILLASANDASNVLAQSISGDIPRFVDQLNARLKELGCEGTHFMNPHGLHHPDHYTTAYDMAIITREALKNPIFSKIVATRSFVKPATNMQPPVTLCSGNRLIRPGPLFYPKAIGVKTGYTTAANGNFVGAAQDGDRTLIAVVLGCPDFKTCFVETRKMFEAAFNEPKMRRVLLQQGSQTFQTTLKDGIEPLKTYISQEVALEYYPSEEPRMRGSLQWDDLIPPVIAGQRVGEVQLIKDNVIWKRVPLLAENSVSPTWTLQVGQYIAGFGLWKVIMIGVLVLAAALYAVIWVVQKRHAV